MESHEELNHAKPMANGASKIFDGLGGGRLDAAGQFTSSDRYNSRAWPFEGGETVFPKYVETGLRLEKEISQRIRRLAANNVEH